MGLYDPAQPPDLPLGQLLVVSYSPQYTVDNCWRSAVISHSKKYELCHRTAGMSRSGLHNHTTHTAQFVLGRMKGKGECMGVSVSGFMSLHMGRV